mmetsp:Transcript_31173/g.69325  ORF Transcript_31173/g.69325 Transcript_31173/m.69325 type:complete len:232 (-) Transcript_31173:1498-2193(-)
MLCCARGVSSRGGGSPCWQAEQEALQEGQGWQGGGQGGGAHHSAAAGAQGAGTAPGGPLHECASRVCAPALQGLPRHCVLRAPAGSHIQESPEELRPDLRVRHRCRHAVLQLGRGVLCCGGGSGASGAGLGPQPPVLRHGLLHTGGDLHGLSDLPRRGLPAHLQHHLHGVGCAPALHRHTHPHLPRLHRAAYSHLCRRLPAYPSHHPRLLLRGGGSCAHHCRSGPAALHRC